MVKKTEDIFIRFGATHERDTQTDGHRMAAYTALCIASRGKNYDNMLSRFHLIPERYGQADRRTDRQTDRFAISISRVSMLTRDKNQFRRFKDVDEVCEVIVVACSLSRRPTGRHGVNVESLSACV